MQNKDIHRIFEDKLDKLVFDKLSNQEITPIDNEWELLRKRLTDNKKVNQRKKYGAAVGLFFITFTTIFLLLKTNSTKENDHPLTIYSFNKNKSTSSENTIQNNNTVTQEKNVNLDKVAPQYNNTPFSSAIVENAEIPIQSNKRYRINSKNNLSANSKNNISDKNLTKEAAIELPSLNDELRFKEDNAITQQNENEAMDSEEPKKVNDKELPNELNAEKNDTDSNIPSTPIADVAIITAPQPVPESKKNKKTRSIPTHYFEDSKSWYVEAYSGMTSSKKNENSFAAFLAPSGYNTMRLQQENSLASMTLGVNIKLRQRHLTFSSGLQYVQLGDRISYDTSFNSNSLVLSANGKTQFTYVEIPVLAGYEWANKRWGFNFQAGISTGILSRLSGQYVSIQNFNSQLFNIADNQQIFRNTVFNLLLSPQVSYYLNDYSNFFITPNYRRNLQPVTKTGSDLTQKYSTWGIQIGVRTRIK